MTDSAQEEVGAGEPPAELLPEEAPEPPTEPEVVVVKPKAKARAKKKPEAPPPEAPPPPKPEPKKRGRPRKELTESQRAAPRTPKPPTPEPSPAEEAPPRSMELPGRDDPMAILAAALHGHRIAQEEAKRKMYQQFVFGNYG